MLDFDSHISFEPNRRPNMTSRADFSLMSISASVSRWSAFHSSSYKGAQVESECQGNKMHHVPPAR